MAKRKRKIQWPKEKGQTIDVQNTTKKTKDRATPTPKYRKSRHEHHVIWISCWTPVYIKK